MVHLFRPVNHHIIDILIGQTEEVCYCYNQFLESSPYPFYNGKFQRVLGDFLKEFSHRFIGCKSFHKGKGCCIAMQSGRLPQSGRQNCLPGIFRVLAIPLPP